MFYAAYSCVSASPQRRSTHITRLRRGGHLPRRSRPRAQPSCRLPRASLGPIELSGSRTLCFNRLFEGSNTSRFCHHLGAKLGSHPAKGRRESGGVWTVICPGRQHFGNLLDSSRPARGLLHTEEVTGSIPASPTFPQFKAMFRSLNLIFDLLPLRNCHLMVCRCAGGGVRAGRIGSDHTRTRSRPSATPPFGSQTGSKPVRPIKSSGLARMAHRTKNARAAARSPRR